MFRAQGQTDDETNVQVTGELMLQTVYQYRKHINGMYKAGRCGFYLDCDRVDIFYNLFILVSP